MKYLFIGEKRSLLAEKMDVTWLDGRLAAKQLFEALINADIDPKQCRFMNWFEYYDPMHILNEYGKKYTVVGMGKKVQKELKANNIPHIAIIHPAARGKIRLKENYFNHIKEALK